MAVRILEDALVDQIAAGEVVERPASVIKELVENSLDAGAKTLRIRLEEGGRKLIRIQDDGCGMDRQDAVMCLERHATSKIRTLEDLIRVGTLGFRGEAVPSIASVSRFEILTRRAEDELGTRVLVEGGTVKSVADAGCAPGTQITVRDLFFNIPVRKSFLRTAPTELGHALDVVAREVLWRPDVDITVVHDGREVLRAPAAPDLAARARAVLGDVAAKLRAFSTDDRGVRAEGLASPEGVDDASGRAVHLYVNGRFVRDPVLRKAVREAYEGSLAPGRSPVVVLHVFLDPSRVDVNAHPAKTEVRFRDPRDVADVVVRAIREVLRHNPPARPVAANLPPTLPLPGLAPHPEDDPRFRVEQPPPELTWSTGIARPVVSPPRLEAALPASDPPRPTPPLPSATPRAQAPAAPEPTVPPVPRQPTAAILAMVEGKYALLRREDQVLCLDVHEARARLARVNMQKGTSGARLLVPRRLNLAAGQAARLEAWETALEHVGISLLFPSPGEVVVRRCPESLLGAVWETILPKVASILGTEAGDDLPSAALDVLSRGWQGPATADEAREILNAGLDLADLTFPVTAADLARLGR